jgi:hypothetical protein
MMESSESEQPVKEKAVSRINPEWTPKTDLEDFSPRKEVRRRRQKARQGRKSKTWWRGYTVGKMVVEKTRGLKLLLSLLNVL